VEPWNTFVEGDNLDVLPRLAAAGDRYDVVYLDPPYNTGNPFAYNDRVAGPRVDRHRAWVAAMRPRLEAVHDVLTQRGAVFVSIDDHEVAYLRLLMDEVFGEDNFLSQIVVNLNAKGRQLGGGFATSHEYLLVYARSLPTCALDPSSPSTVDPADFPLTEADGRRYRRLPLRNTNKKFNPITAPTMHFAIYGSPESGRVCAAPFADCLEIKPVFGDGGPAVWRWSAARIIARPDDLVCRWVRGATGRRADVYQLDWLHEGRRKKLRTIWLASEIGSTDTAVAELKALVGHLFESPKPTGLLRRILETMPDDARVLDPYAGSGTTGHAVALQNAADGGRRTCLSVNSPEPTRPGSNAALAGYALVSDVTRVRLRAVADLVGGGYAELELSSLPTVSTSRAH
jgi:adenine-specific DNA-methyltransferase